MFHWPAKPYQSAEIRKPILCFQGGAGSNNDEDCGTTFSN